jgi:hypothetical protein
VTRDSSAIALRLKDLFFALLFLVMASGLAACGGSAQFSPPVAVSPGTASLPLGWTLQFSTTIRSLTHKCHMVSKWSGGRHP